MKKILFLILCSLSVLQVSSQIKKIQLVKSDSLKGFSETGVAHVIKPIFSHEGSTLAADSANFNQQQNVFDAFGNVVITQSDGTVVYSDLLNYNGNTRIAVLTNNVRLVDKDATLTTDYLTYNMITKIGTYTTGGKITNGKNVLTSKNGYYFSSTRDSYFRHDVVVTSPDAVIKSDTLRYNTGSKMAYFYGPTNIYGKDDTLYTENGEYNTNTDQARFGKNNLYRKGTTSLKGDSLFYDRKNGYGKAIGHILSRDSINNFILQGNLATFTKADESTVVTENAYLVFTTKDSSKVDSIWMTADTLQTKVILTRKLVPSKKLDLKKNSELEDANENLPATTITQTDSVKIKPPDKVKTDTLISKNNTPRPSVQDTSKTRVVFAFHNVKIFKSDLQARADSVSYSYSDSLIRCYRSPMVWAQGSQLSADTIFMQLKNKKLDNMVLQHNGFIVNTETDSAKYNQVKGKLLTGVFKDSELEQMYVDGNAESIYYVKEDSTYSGLNKSVSSRMKVLFSDNTLQEVIFIRKPEMRYFPINKIPEDTEILKGFIWKPKDRPKSKEEIIPTLAENPKIITPEKPKKAPPKQPASKK